MWLDRRIHFDGALRRRSLVSEGIDQGGRGRRRERWHIYLVHTVTLEILSVMLRGGYRTSRDAPFIIRKHVRYFCMRLLRAWLRSFLLPRNDALNASHGIKC